MKTLTPYNSNLIIEHLKKILDNHDEFEKRISFIEDSIFELKNKPIVAIECSKKRPTIDKEELTNKIIACIHENGPHLSVLKLSELIGHSPPTMSVAVSKLVKNEFIVHGHGTMKLKEKGKQRLRQLSIKSLDIKNVSQEKQALIDAIESACTCKVHNDAGRLILRFIALNGPSLNYGSMKSITSEKQIKKRMSEFKNAGIVVATPVDRMKFNYFVALDNLVGHSNCCDKRE